ncbi:hypothetical protein JTE90_003723 [Oedothorax gibbosus]|uniref:Chitin-binding type-2 domain-containing protein n=1 Tax=Oedothorax gibbosus TaxID=931172 RepID=A0AAV6VD27_9ARAC|nr:hypothetical protein JTE90_003723 [Oedothorax gibbosus]
MFFSIGLVLLCIGTSGQHHRVVRRFSGDWGQAAANQQPVGVKGDTAGSRWSRDDIQQKGEDDIVWNTRPQGNDKGGADLEALLRGVPGQDFPDLTSVPETAFQCPDPGYYADTEAGCMVFHICQGGGRKDSFLCPLGTIFNQRHLVCDWWFNVNCSESESLFGRNMDIFGEVASTATTTTTTERPQVPWTSQDLDKKRPPGGASKGWPPAAGKKSPPRADVASKRGGAKSDSWGRADVQQKEVTLSWSTAAEASKAYSATYSTAKSTSTNPVWYGIDGQPSRDQSDTTMWKRTGPSHPSTAASFGSRLHPSSTFQPTKRAASRTSPAHSSQWTPPYPDTSIVPSGVAGVWEQDTPSHHFTQSERFVHRVEAWGEAPAATAPKETWRRLKSRGGSRDAKRKAALHPNSVIRRKKDRY